MNYASQRIFTEFSLWRLLTTGCGMRRDNDMRGVSKLLHKEKNLLEHENGIKCFALSATCDDIVGSNDGSENSGVNVEPFLLRSYKHPYEEQENNNGTNDRKNESPEMMNGTSQIKVWEAMAATSAIPGAFDRIQLDNNKEAKVLADGSVCCNCPISIALKEAQTIWPNRTIGVVLSFGLDHSQDALAKKAIDSFRLNHPGLYYERIMIPQVSLDYNSLETDKERIREMEELVRGYMRSGATRSRMTCLLQELFKGKCRRT